MNTTKLTFKDEKLIAGKSKVDIFDAAGGLQMSIQNIENSNAQLDLGDLDPGIYFYKVRTDKGEFYSGKLIKMSD